MIREYVLAADGRTPVKVPHLATDPHGYAAAMIDKHERYDWNVAKTTVGDVQVSTVFLFRDERNQAMDPGDPECWETLVRGGTLDQECERYTSRDAAERGHAAMVQRVRDAEVSK